MLQRWICAAGEWPDSNKQVKATYVKANLLIVILMYIYIINKLLIYLYYPLFMNKI